MQRLFVKIFLWFWLATSLVWSAFLLVGWSTESRPGVPPWHEDMEKVVRLYGRMAVREYERGGSGTLDAFAVEVGREANVRLHVFDAGGGEIGSGKAPREVRDAVESFRAEGRPRVAPVRRALLVLSHISDGAGRPYIVAVEFPVERPPGLGSLVARLAAAVLVAGVGCYGLAYYLTRPVASLREASRRIASGDLAARVGAGLRARRDEFGDLSRDFDDMAERLEAFLVSERRLLRDISHELRSPLARLGVALGLARQTSGSEAGFALDRIELESERLNELIGRLLTLARLQAGEAALALDVVNLEEIVREVVSDAAFEAHNVARDVVLDAAESCAVVGDGALLKSAVENVVRNAVRHTPEGTAVEVTLAIEAIAGKRFAVVKVRDRGTGVPAEAIAEIFRPFYRVEAARDRLSGGAGLGLTIAESAVRLHDGTVTAENDGDGGLRVTIRLPVASRE